MLAAEIIIGLTLILELQLDSVEFRWEGKVDHRRGLLIRLTACILLLIISSWTAILLLAGVYLLLFDHIMGYIVAKDWMHIGTEAKWDKLVGKIPGLPRLFLRGLIFAILASIHYSTNQWTELLTL